MKNTDLTSLERITSRLPKSIKKQPFSAFNISGALSEFINEEFRGLAEVNSDIHGSGSVNISAEHLAYFLKLLLKYVGGRSFLSINVSLCSGKFIIDIRSSEDIEFTLSERASLTSAAKSAGLNLNISGRAVTLLAEEYIASRAMFVYAGDIRLLRRILTEIFFGN